MSDNRLYYGDNLHILRHHIPKESVDLIYLDPPFNSDRNYNVLFKDESGRESDAQITAFEDTWHWGRQAQETYEDLVMRGPDHVATVMTAMHTLVGTNQMLAYLVMMTARLVELHRVLKPTGSLYLHCDPTASHYLKIILDALFGPEQFINEITWKRTTAHGNTKQGANHFGRVADTILFYAKSKQYTWNQIYTSYSDKYIETKYRYVEPETNRRYRLDNLTGPGGAAKGNAHFEFLGITRYWRYSKENMERLYKEGRIIQTKPGTVPQYKRYLDEMAGQPIQSVWTDIDPVNSQAKERMNYPTQKPVSLLERIVQASSNPGDVVLDPFAGCGTAIAAAQKLGRRWIGIDITHLSVALLKYRLRDMFDLDWRKDYRVIGEPEDVPGARQLAEEDRFQFQFWAASLVEAQPLGGEAKKGKDKGVDGVIRFFDGSGQKQTTERVLVQVKSGKVSSRDIRDLVGTIEREKAAIGVFITLENPTRDMVAEALSAGVYESQSWGAFRKIQILTIADLLAGKNIDMPRQHVTFKPAERVKENKAGMEDMFGGR